MSEVETKPAKSNGNGGPTQLQDWETGHELATAIGTVRTTADLSLRSFRDEAEIHAISTALRQTGWNRKRAARLLSISYRGLLYKIRRHNITPGQKSLKSVTSNGNVQS